MAKENNMEAQALNGATPAPVTPADRGSESLNAIYDGSVNKDDDIDDLIPEELKIALKTKSTTSNKDTDDDDDEDLNKKSSRSTQDADDDTDDDTFVSKEELDGEPGEDEEDTKLNSTEDDEDVDISPEGIERLLKGELDAAKPDKDVDDDTPFWHEDDTYQELTKQLSNFGAKPEQVDKIIRAAIDKSKIDNSKLVQGLENKVKESENSADTYKTELTRLKEIERGVRFDYSDEVKEKFGAPMQNAAQEIHTILQREGVNVPAVNLLTAKNKTEMMKLLEDTNLEDADLTKISNQWRSYKETETAYNAAKTEAQKDLKKALSSSISKETVQSILRNSLGDFVKADPKYGYISDAIRKGVQQDEPVSKLIARGKTNFVNMVEALTAPSEHIHSEQWLNGLAKFMFNAAHDELTAKKYYDLAREHSTTVDNFKKLARDYKKLASSAKGLTGKGKGVATKAGRRDKSEKEQESEILKEFNDFLKNDNLIDDILG